VERLTAEETTLTLVNLNPVEERMVIVQGGAYGEHQIQKVTTSQGSCPVGRSWLALRLAPGCGGRLTLAMSRYANPPTLTFPWDRL